MRTDQIILGLGTNIGKRAHNLQQALDALAQIVTVTAVSPVYRTEPWGLVDQPDFYNLCLIAQTTLSPTELLTQLKQIEQAIGRTPTVRWGPRLIDIDLLFYNDFVLHAERLTIPHASIADRAFVLLPLRHIAPDFVHPVLGQTIEELATAVDATTAEQLADIQLSIPITKS